VRLERHQFVVVIVMITTAFAAITADAEERHVAALAGGHEQRRAGVELQGVDSREALRQHRPR